MDLQEMVPSVEFSDFYAQRVNYYSEYQSFLEAPKYVLLFMPPIINYQNFINQLWKNKVCLENVRVEEKMIIGTVKVMNIGFEKTVELKLTYDNWMNFRFIKCFYSVSENMHIDVFRFQFDIPSDVKNVKFCIHYKCNGKDYWDNNGSLNYLIGINSLYRCPEATAS